MSNKIALYCRVDNKNMKEIERQKNLLWQYCNSIDKEIYCAYLDNGFSIYEVRPQFNNLLQEVKERKFDTIVVTDLDIISTNTRVLRGVLKLLKDYNCNLITLKENYNYKEDYKQFLEHYNSNEKLSKSVLYDFEHWGQMNEDDWGVC